MYTTISFPFFGIEVNPARMLNLGPLSIHFYGAIIAAGLMLAVVYAWKRCKQFGINEDALTDGAAAPPEELAHLLKQSEA